MFPNLFTHFELLPFVKKFENFHPSYFIPAQSSSKSLCQVTHIPHIITRRMTPTKPLTNKTDKVILLLDNPIT